MSDVFEIYKPRTSYFVEKIKIITQKFFRLMIEGIAGRSIPLSNNDNIYSSIYNFLYKYHSKYKDYLFFKNILQLEDDFKEEFNQITKKCFLMFYATDKAVEFLNYEEEDDSSNELRDFKLKYKDNYISDKEDDEGSQEEDNIKKNNLNLFDVPKKKIKKRNYNDLDIFKGLYALIYDKNKDEKDEINKKRKKIK